MLHNRYGKIQDQESRLQSIHVNKNEGEMKGIPLFMSFFRCRDEMLPVNLENKKNHSPTM